MSPWQGGVLHVAPGLLLLPRSKNYPSFLFCEGTAYSKKLYFCKMKGFLQFFVRVARFYVEGFQSMTWGRTLWILILVKLFVIFVVLRIFFFQPALSGMDEAEKQEAVGRALSQNP